MSKSTINKDEIIVKKINENPKSKNMVGKTRIFNLIIVDESGS